MISQNVSFFRSDDFSSGKQKRKSIDVTWFYNINHRVLRKLLLLFLVLGCCTMKIRSLFRPWHRNLAHCFLAFQSPTPNEAPSPHWWLRRSKCDSRAHHARPQVTKVGVFVWDWTYIYIYIMAFPWLREFGGTPNARFTRASTTCSSPTTIPRIRKGFMLP